MSFSSLWNEFLRKTDAGQPLPFAQRWVQGDDRRYEEFISRYKRNWEIISRNEAENRHVARYSSKDPWKTNSVVGSVDTLFLPNKLHKIWQGQQQPQQESQEGQQSQQPQQQQSQSQTLTKKSHHGVDDVMALTLIFSGNCPPNVLEKMSYQQIFFYIFFILNLTKRKE